MENRTFKILNIQAPNRGFFELSIIDNLCSIPESNNIHGLLTHESENGLTILWKHVKPFFSQEYIILSKNILIKKLSLDSFNSDKYLIYNLDLLNISQKKIDLYNHYYSAGIKEGRLYDGYLIQNDKIIKKLPSLPENFDAITYQSLHADLAKLDTYELKHHYVHSGFYEKRAFAYQTLPIDFDPKSYRMLYSDLSNLNDQELIAHYLNHGIAEKRDYKLANNALHSIYKKFTPVFINHDTSLTGAPIFLYDFVTYLKEKNIFINPVIIEAYPNSLFDHYDIDKYYHFNDVKELFKILDNINPSLIYSNSLNLMYHNLEHFQIFFNKTIFHFHESINNVSLSKLQTIKDEQIFVVADRIKKDFEAVGCSNVTVFPPFFNEHKATYIKNQPNIQKLFLSNSIRNIDYNKTKIGMSGSICARKNFLLFYKLAENNPDIEFLWIGGPKDWQDEAYKIYNEVFTELPNFFHVSQTKNPYSFYKILDALVVTSKDDPCPIVILENLLLDKPVIYLKDNIFYDHSLCPNVIAINNTNLDHNTTLLEISKQIKNIDAIKFTDAGSKYIKQNFSKPKLLSKNNQKNTNFVILSYYLKSILHTQNINYYTNLINTFNIKNKLKFDIIVYLSIEDNYQLQYKTQLFNQFKQLLNLNHIFIVDNMGWNFNGLIRGIKHIYDKLSINETTKILHLHNKSNNYWRDYISRICYVCGDELDNYDTIVNDQFYIDCKLTDLNREVMRQCSVMKEASDMPFKYLGGAFFTTKLSNLKKLYDNYDYILANLTTKNTVSHYWIDVMKNNKLFHELYVHSLTDTLNEPIDPESHEIVKMDLAKNYLDLQHNFGKRGIADFHFEHALERYVGYLISNNQKIYTTK